MEDAKRYIFIPVAKFKIKILEPWGDKAENPLTGMFIKTAKLESRPQLTYVNDYEWE